MGLFSAVNEEYCKWFEGENPPSRSCVSVPLPPGCFVMLDLVALRGSGEALAKEGAACAQRQVLHVRSISSWAPVCIGPYCQANTLGPGGGFALIAGQIGLQAASMTFPARRSGRPPVPCAGGAASKEAISERRPIHEQELSLCVSHASSVASAVGAGVSRGCVFATLYVSEEAAAAAAAARGGAAVAAHATAGGMDRTDEEESVAGEGRGDTRRTSSSDASTSTGAVAPAGGSGGWLEGMVDECRVLMEGRLSQEQAEAAAEAAGTEGREDDDSAEDGWTSDPEELAKEAARKMVVARRVPILAVVVPSLPRNATVELEVLCMSRAALSVLPCRHYPPSCRMETLSASPSTATKGLDHPVPGRFIPTPPPPTSAAAVPASPEAPSAAGGGSHDGAVGGARMGAAAACEEGGVGGAKRVSARVMTTGSTVDRILSVAVSSLSIVCGNSCTASADVGGGRGGGGGAAAVATAAATAPATAAATAAAAAPAARETSIAPNAAANANITRPLSASQLEQAMGLVLAGVSDAVSAARLRWHDVANLRVYYNTRRHGPPGVAATGSGGGGDGSGGMEEGCLKRATFLALAGATRNRPAVTFVPVSDLGGGAAVSVHATAWSLDR
ncbi:unnamed protein product [Ectocarpus sp. 4 AP-2014]